MTIWAPGASPRRRRIIVVAAAGGVALAASLWLTRQPGPGLTPDGMSYLGSAESWVAGRGLRIPYASWSDADSTSALRAFPPGFPLAVGLTIRLGFSPVQGARVVVALAAAVTAATIAAMFDALAGVLAALLGTAAVLLIPAVVGDHVAALSEPMFLACLMVEISLMVRRPDRPLRYGLAACAAAATRYAGLALGAAGTLWAFAQPGDARTRVRRAALAGGPTLLLTIAWVLRTRLVSSAMPVVATRPSFDIATALAQAKYALAASLAPALDDTRWWGPASVLAAVLAVLVLASQLRSADAGVRRVFSILALFAACYVPLILAAKLFFGHDIPLDDRILSPLILSFGIAVAIGVARGWKRWSVPVRAAGTVATAAWLAGAALSAANLVDDIRHNGYDFASNEWRQSPTLRWLRREGSGLTLYSNQPVPVYYYLRRPSRSVPASLAPDTVAALGAAFAARPSALVAFADTSWEPGSWPAALAARLHLREAARLSDGTVWVTGHP